MSRRSRSLRALAILLTLAATSASCSSGDDPSGEATTTTAPPLRLMETRKLTWDGVARSYGIAIPRDVVEPAPVVVLLHAIGKQQIGIDMGQAAIDNGFAIVTPLGLDTSWNAGTCCYESARNGVDDAGFIDAVVADVVKRDDIDAARVFGVGFSNGGMMVYRIACERPSLFAGVAVVEGTLAVDRCDRGEAGDTPDLLVIHQTGDEIVPYRGSTNSALATDGTLRSVEGSLLMWLKAHACRKQGATRHEPRRLRTVWRCTGATETERIIISGGSHRWPQAPIEPISATDTIVDFFGLAKNS